MIEASLRDVDAVAPAPTADAALRRLVEHRRDFLRFLRGRLASPEEAEDALQDFCVKVTRAARRPDDETAIDAWLGRILRNTLTDAYRRRAARRRAAEAHAREALTAESAIETASEADGCACARRLLPTLRPDHRAALRRVELEEAPRAEVAAEFGVSVNALNVRLHRARRALRREVEAACAGCCDDGFGSCDCAEREER